MHRGRSYVLGECIRYPGNIYIYIYIERERERGEREGGRERENRKIIDTEKERKITR